MKRRTVILISVAVLLVAAVAAIAIRQADSSDTTARGNEARPTSNATVSPSPPPPDRTPAFDKTKHSLTDPASPWVIVNKRRPLSPINYAPTDLTRLVSGEFLRTEPADKLTEMFQAARAAGLTLTAASGYRSYDVQVRVYASEVRQYGQKTADTQSARPGHSEHQTGLVIDISGGGCNIEDCFGTTAEGKWAAANAHKYGYILRYPADKAGVTGYRGEPWHFRYVGTELATEMQKLGITTLEEFFDVGSAPDYQ